MVKLGAKSPYVTSIPKSYNCGYCVTAAPTPIDPCPLLPKTGYERCSPWPHRGGINNYNTRASPFLATQTGDQLSWSPLSLQLASGDLILYTSPVIGSDGTIYQFSNQGKMYAINPNGSQKTWSPLNLQLASDDRFAYASPIIGSDGTIYQFSLEGSMYAINPNGSQKTWSPLHLQLASGDSI